MDKRTVWYGIPMYLLHVVVRGVLLFSIGIVVFPWGFIRLIDSGAFSVDAVHSEKIALVVGAIGLIFLILALKSMSGLQTFVKSFQKLHGRVCFRCGYEIADGLDVCSECGARWRLDDLNRGWRKTAERGDR